LFSVTIRTTPSALWELAWRGYRSKCIDIVPRKSEIQLLDRAVEKLKDQVERSQRHGVVRRLLEDDKDASAMTQAIGYLDVLLDMFQASPATSIQRVPHYLPHRQMDTRLHTEANKKQFMEAMKRIETDIRKIMLVRLSTTRS
jgi:hypothetical protein